MSIDRRTTTTRQWLQAHPGYYRRYIAQCKADKLAQGWSAKNGTLPILKRSGKQLPYSISVSNPLHLTERVLRQVSYSPSRSEELPDVIQQPIHPFSPR